MGERAVAWVVGPIVAMVGYLLIHHRHHVSAWYRERFRRWYAGTRFESQADRITPKWAAIGGVFCLLWAGLVIVVVGILDVPI